MPDGKGWHLARGRFASRLAMGAAAHNTQEDAAMGTRCITTIADDMLTDEAGDEIEIVVIYRQFDGYPSEHGIDLCNWGEGVPVTNGISGNGPCFNGMGCAAASLVGALKGDEPGNIYLYPAGTRDCDEEYTYRLSAKDGRIWLRAFDYDGTSFYDGPLDGFRRWITDPGNRDA